MAGTLIANGHEVPVELPCTLEQFLMFTKPIASQCRCGIEWRGGVALRFRHPRTGAG